MHQYGGEGLPAEGREAPLGGRDEGQTKPVPLESRTTASTCVECAIQIPQKQNLLLAEQKF